MKNVVFGACTALALAGTIGLAAQTPTQPKPDPQRQPMTQRPGMQNDSITLTGCLKAADAVTAGEATGTPKAAMPAGTQFVLTDVEHGGAMDKTAGTDGRAATGRSDHAAMMDNAMFALKTSGASVDLKSHVNEKVQVTGTIAGMDKMGMGKDDKGVTSAREGQSATVPRTQPGTPSPSTGKATDGAHAGMGSDMWHTLTVSSITKLTGSCGS
ncbi:MAG: hypothetical protein AB7O67_18375 [Vicinamibacterales bacterium]